MPTTNVDIAAMLRDIADLLESESANPFRVRAYRNAARQIEALPQAVDEWLASGEDLTRLPGIGKDLAAKIREIAETGRSRTLEQLGWNCGSCWFCSFGRENLCDQARDLCRHPHERDSGLSVRDPVGRTQHCFGGQPDAPRWSRIPRIGAALAALHRGAALAAELDQAVPRPVATWRLSGRGGAGAGAGRCVGAAGMAVMHERVSVSQAGAVWHGPHRVLFGMSQFAGQIAKPPYRQGRLFDAPEP